MTTVTEQAPARALPLRDYQRECIEALHAAWGRGVRRPAAVLPTGTGKTVIFSHLIREFLATPGERRRVVVLAHRDELVSQARGKVLSVAPGLSVGIVKGAVNDADAAVVCASVQTLRNPKRSAQVRDVGLVIVDEAHHATATSYLDVLDYYGCFGEPSTTHGTPEDAARVAATRQRGGALAVGFTATMERSDGVALGNVWEEIAYEYSILKAIRRKYLCDPIGHAVKVADMDMSQVRTTAGDFREGDLGEALSDSSALHVAAEKYLELGGGQQGLAFLPTVATAHETVEVFGHHGITAAAVDGTTPTDERRAIVRDYTAGNIPVLSNCMVFTEGTDFPNAAVALLMRPTQSRSLYVQMAGRVLRPDPERPGKVATLLDISGAAARHSLIGRGTLLGADVEPEDGESLAELDDRLAELAAEEAARERGTGPAPVKPVRLYEAEDYELDLFHGQRLVWHHAPRTGVPFVMLAERLVMVMPDGAGGFDVAWIWRTGKAPHGASQRGGWIARHVADHGYALAWAEGAHEDHGWDPGYSDRTRAWRKRKVVPESKQALYASALGIPWLPDWRAGQLADAIDTKLTGKAVDAFAGPYLTKIGALVS